MTFQKLPNKRDLLYEQFEIALPLLLAGKTTFIPCPDRMSPTTLRVYWYQWRKEAEIIGRLRTGIIAEMSGENGKVGLKLLAQGGQFSQIAEPVFSRPGDAPPIADSMDLILGKGTESRRAWANWCLENQVPMDEVLGLLDGQWPSFGPDSPEGQALITTLPTQGPSL